MTEIKETVWALFTVGYVHEDGTITEPVRVTYHTEQDEIRAFASKHGYHNSNYKMVEMEIIHRDVWGNLEMQSVEDTEEIYFD